MNDFGINLKGKRGVFKERTFYIPKASAKDRTFNIEGGPGSDPDPLRSRKVTGHWLVDGAKDAVSSYDFEYILDGEKKIKPVVSELVGVDVAPDPKAATVEAVQKPVKRKR